MKDRDHSQRKRVANPGTVRAFHEEARAVCSCGEIGTRAWFKFTCPHGLAGSNPARSTTPTLLPAAPPQGECAQKKGPVSKVAYGA